MRNYICLCLLLFSQLALANIEKYPVKLGDSTVIIKRESHGPGKSFVHLHASETTALRAAKTYIRKHGGSLVYLQHKKQRNIEFILHNKHYEFDPNRIYSTPGIKSSLNSFGGSSSEAIRVIEGFAEKIVSLIPDGKVIAVHNNSDYSLHDYLPGNSLANDAKLLNIVPQKFYRNFFLVTKKHEYLRLSSKKFNSILQIKNISDDGSLSVRLKARNYVNVEAGYDQLKEQIEMLKQA